MGKTVGGLVERKEKFIFNAMRVVCVVVIDNKGNAEQGSEWLCNDIRGDEMTMKDVRLCGENKCWKCSEVEWEVFVGRE